MTHIATESKTPSLAVYLDRAPTLIILFILIFLIFARTGESIHGQVTKLGEYFWDGYASLRSDAAAPACDPNMDIAQKLNQLEVEANGANAGFDLFAQGFDRKSAETSLAAQKQKCIHDMQVYESYQKRLTPTIRVFRSIESQFAAASVFATAQQQSFLVVLLFVAAAIATQKRHHIAFRPMLWRLDYQVSTFLQLLVNSCLAYSAWKFRDGTFNSSIEVANPFLINGVVAGSTVLSLISLYQLFNIPKTARAGGKIGRALLSVPLYTFVMLAFSVIVFVFQRHVAGLSLYFSAFFDNAGTYLDVSLYLWCGMLLKQTQLGERVFSIFTPWRLPAEVLATLAILIMAVPTAYTGASSIIILAAGVVVYRELRKVGARRQLALAVTAMSGSSGVVLKPCLIVIIISILNKQVTTDVLFHWGGRVFLLTVFVFFCYSMLIKREPLKVAPINEALMPSVANLRTLIPYIIVFVLVTGLYSLSLDAHLDQFSAPIILPVLLIAMIVYERKISTFPPIYDDPERKGTVSASLTQSMSDASVHIGALLFMMSTFIIMTSLGGKTVSATFLNDIDSMWALMACVTLMFVLVGMFMESIAAVGLISLTIAPVAYAKGINPVHFWMTCLVALELGYLSPPMGLSHIFTRQVVGEVECGIAATEGDSFFYRHERLLLPIFVMATTLLIVAFAPIMYGYY